MAVVVVVNDNTKCQIDRTNKSPPTSVISPPPLQEVHEVKPVEIEVREVEPVKVVEPAIVEPATLKSPEQVLYVKRKMPKRKRKFGRGATRGGDQKSSRPNIVYQHAVPVPHNDDDNNSTQLVHAKWMNTKQLRQKLNRIGKKIKCAEKTVTATRKKLIAAEAYCKMLASLSLGRSRCRSRSPPGLRGHSDSQTIVFFLPKLRPAIFTIKKFCVTTLTFTSASPLK